MGDTEAVLTPLHRPRRLQEGSVVRIIAPSGPIDPAKLHAGVDILRSWGLQVEIGEHTLDHNGYLAGTDSGRITDLARSWCDPRVSAVICARGGYGLQRIVDWIDWSELAAARDGEDSPVLVGFSDATSLHEAVATRLSVASLHAPMPASRRFQQDLESQERLRHTLFGTELDLGPLTGDAVRSLVGGRATGVLCGGNLTALAAGVGTYTAQSSLAGGLVLLEDVAETPYRVDRLITQLLRAGVLDGVAGIVGGSWVGCGDPEDIDKVLLERLGPLEIPILNGLDFGHGLANHTIPLGLVGALDADQGLLWWQAPALR